MASTLTFAGSLPVLVRASGPARQPDPNHKNSVSPASSSTWWAPLFECSSYPDYVNTNARSIRHPGECDPDAGRPRPRFALGCFTEEKAKQLRRKTMEGKSFHDVMYHSAIAARLASDLSGRPEK
uniref:Uncharacterized protein LOC105136393 n=1 Tax=Rhizophora mucronata TaxID=61149 RepID=A0A2P2PNX9_RHIMU